LGLGPWALRLGPVCLALVAGLLVAAAAPVAFDETALDRWQLLAWLAVCLGALFDLWWQFRPVESMSGWRVALGLTLRLVPLMLLITVPWTVAYFSGRVFSVQALGLAMIDMLAAWAVMALVEVTAAAALLVRRLLDEPVF